MAALKTNKWYVRYCEEVASGVLELPPYQQQPDGSVQIEYGEAFCRVAECSNARKKYTATNNLVTHLKSHDGVQVPSENKGGRVAQKVIDQAVSDRYLVWYKGLFVAPGPCPPGPALPSPAVPHPAAGPSPGPSPGPSTQPEPRRATRHSASQDIQPIQLEEDDNIEEASSEEDEDQEEDQEDQEDQESEELSDVAETLPPLPLKRDGTVHILDMRKQVVTMGAKVPCGACKVYKNCCKDDEECENFTLFAPR